MARIPRVTRNALTDQSGFRPQVGDGWAAMASIATAGEALLRPVALQAAKEQGANATYRDDNGNLRVDEKSMLGGEMSAVHNNAAFAAYLGQSQIDVRETLTELRRKHAYDPVAFKDAADAYVKNVVNNSPPALKADIRLSASAEAVSMFDGLRVGEINRSNDKADKTSKIARAALADDVVALIQGGASWDDPRVVAKMNEIGSITAFRANSAFIGETEAEAKVFVEGIRGDAAVARFMRDVDKLGGADKISPDERDRLRKTIEDPNIPAATREKMYRVLDGTLKTLDGRSFVRDLVSDKYENRASAYNGTATGNWARTPASGVEFVPNYGPNSRESGRRAGRSLDADPEIQNIVSNAAEVVFGAGTKILVNSGFRTIKAAPGRHPEGKAMDIQIRRPDGSVVMASDPDMREFAMVAGAMGARGVGAGAEYMGGNSVHVDIATHGGPGHRAWKSLGNKWETDFIRTHTEGYTYKGVKYTSGEGVPEVKPSERKANQTALTINGIPVSPANEAIIQKYGEKIGVKILLADPTTPLSEIEGKKPPAGDAAGGVPQADIRGPTAGDIINEAHRKMAPPGTDDLPEMRRKIEAIPDAEVRAIAHKELNAWYALRSDEEREAGESYRERIAKGDHVTRQEIINDYNIDNNARASLLNAIETQNKTARDLIETLSRINDPNAYIDPYSTKDRNAVDNAYKHAIGGTDPLSEKGMAAAGQIITKTGFAPKSFLGALRGAMNSGDPARIAMAMGIAEGVTRQYPGAFSPYGKDGEALAMDAAEWRAELGLGLGAEEAGKRMAGRRTPEWKEKRKQRHGDANDFAKELKVSDITAAFDQEWPGIGLFQTDPNIPDQLRDAAMAAFRREARIQFIESGSKDVAKARALEAVKRVYGPTNVAGPGNSVMRLPPESIYPAIDGGHDYITRQLETVVKEQSGQDIPKEDIILQSDDETQRDLEAGRPPSYQYWYFKDGKIQRGKDRFFADIAIEREALRERNDRASAISDEFRDRRSPPVDPDFIEAQRQIEANRQARRDRNAAEDAAERARMDAEMGIKPVPAKAPLSPPGERARTETWNNFAAQVMSQLESGDVKLRDGTVITRDDMDAALNSLGVMRPDEGVMRLLMRQKKGR